MPTLKDLILDEIIRYNKSIEAGKTISFEVLAEAIAAVTKDYVMNNLN